MHGQGSCQVRVSNGAKQTNQNHEGKRYRNHKHLQTFTERGFQGLGPSDLQKTTLLFYRCFFCCCCESLPT